MDRWITLVHQGLFAEFDLRKLSYKLLHPNSTLVFIRKKKLIDLQYLGYFVYKLNPLVKQGGWTFAYSV